MSLEIIIKGRALDLLPGEDSRFYMTKQLHNLVDLETRNSDFTKTITIPITDTNRQLIGLELPNSLRHTTAPSTFIPCDVIIKGVPIIPNAQLLLTVESVVGRTAEITIFGGATQFFSQLQDIPISALGWSDLDIPWTLADVAATAGNLEGITYGNNTWFSNVSGLLAEEKGMLFQVVETSNPELDISGVWLYCHTIMERIFAQLVGLTVDLSLMDERYYNIAIAVPNFSPWDKWKTPAGSYSQVSAPDDPTNVYIDLNTFFPLAFPDIITDDPGNWDAGLVGYVIITEGTYRFNLSAVGNIARYASSGPYIFTFYEIQNTTTGEIIGRVDVPDSTAGGGFTPFSVQIDITAFVDAGDLIQVRLETGPSSNGLGTNKIEIIEPTHQVNFSLGLQGGNSGDFLEVSESIPVINQVQFVKEIFKLYNIVATQKNGVVLLSRMGELLNNPTFEKQIAINREIELSSVFPGYGQTNVFKYADNDLVLRTDSVGSFPMEAANIPKLVVKIDSAFSASDDQAVKNALGQFGQISLPFWDMTYRENTDNKMTLVNGSIAYSTQERNDIRPGDYLYINPLVTPFKRKVVTVFTDFNGEFDLPSPQQQNETDWNHWSFEKNDHPQIYIAQMGRAQGNLNLWNGGDFLAANVQWPVFTTQSGIFDDPRPDLRWTKLIEQSYQILTRALRRPFIVVGWFEITAIQFFQLDGMQMVYVPEYAAYFYVNKFEQWKPNSLVRLQLIKLDE